MEAQIFMVKLAEAIRKERRSQSYRISEKSLEAYVLKDALSGKETVCLRNRWRYPLQPCSFSLAFQLYIYIYIQEIDKMLQMHLSGMAATCNRLQQHLPGIQEERN